MWLFLATFVDIAHATFMAMWVLGIPLLFCHSWPRLTRTYALFAIGFIGVNQVSYQLLGECFLTTLSRACWERAMPGGLPPGTEEWFTVRLAMAIFRMTPSHRDVKIATQLLIAATAVGVLLTVRRRSPTTT